MAGDLADRFLESQKRSEAILARLKEEPLGYEAFRDRLEAYILARLMLPDTEEEKNLYRLAAKSIRALAPKGAGEQAVVYGDHREGLKKLAGVVGFELIVHH